jgi:hypothetical protein
MAVMSREGRISFEPQNGQPAAASIGLRNQAKTLRSHKQYHKDAIRITAPAAYAIARLGLINERSAIKLADAN